MSETIISALGCFALGLMTTMHPCPLTTNIAAISLVSGVAIRRQRRIIILASFAFGYLMAFAGLAMLINAGIFAVPNLSLFLQQVISGFLGPLLIFVGMVLSGLINLNRFYRAIKIERNYWLTKGTPFSTFFLGIVLALTFCPATASIFFGMMIPLSVANHQHLLFPLLYASGAILPILVISYLISQGVVVFIQKNWIKQISKYAGWILIGLGICIALEQLYF